MTRHRVQKLLTGGADPNAAFRGPDGEGIVGYPLSRLASGNRDPRVIQMLLNAGADVNAADSGHVTALQLAAWFNPNAAVIWTLLQAGADPPRSDGNGGRTLLYLLVGRPDAEPDIVRRVLDSGVPATARIIGRSVISHAASHAGNPEVIRVLIDAGADPNAPDWIDGCTPLTAATRRNPDPRVIDVLREAVECRHLAQSRGTLYACARDARDRRTHVDNGAQIQPPLL